MTRARKFFFALALVGTFSTLAAACSESATGPKASFDTTCEQQGSNNRC